MKPANAIVPGALCALILAAGGCSQEGVGNEPTGGAGTTTMSGGVGGSPSAGGSAAGASALGGSVAAGGAAGGSIAVAGHGAGGASGGGAGGAGGSAAGTAPVGGSGGGAAVTPAQIVPTLDGYMWIGTCSGVGAGLDCKLNDEQNQCPNSTAAAFAQRGVLRKAEHVVGGSKDTKYTINFEVRGIAGGKFYTGGKQRTTAFSPTAANDTWYEGGTPTDSKWNTWEIRVEPPVTGAPNVYYLNAFDPTSKYDGWHSTFPIGFSASFPVMGGSKITLVIHDSNCLGQQNCGQTPEGGQPNCDAPRSVDLAGMSPQPMNFVQPYTQSGDSLHPQWLFIDVKSVSAG